MCIVSDISCFQEGLVSISKILKRENSRWRKVKWWSYLLRRMIEVLIVITTFGEPKVKDIFFLEFELTYSVLFV